MAIESTAPIPAALTHHQPACAAVCRAMLPHISDNGEPQMPGLWRREPWAELVFEEIPSYRVRLWANMALCATTAFVHFGSADVDSAHLHKTHTPTSVGV